MTEDIEGRLTSSVGVRNQIDDLVTNVVCKDVGVLLAISPAVDPLSRSTYPSEGLNGRSVFVEKIGGPSGGGSIDGSIERKRNVKPELAISQSMAVLNMTLDLHDVDSSLIQHLHALIVVQAGVHRVDSDGIDTELLQIGDVSSTVGGIREGIDVRRSERVSPARRLRDHDTDGSGNPPLQMISYSHGRRKWTRLTSRRWHHCSSPVRLGVGRRHPTLPVSCRISC